MIKGMNWRAPKTDSGGGTLEKSRKYSSTQINIPPDMAKMFTDFARTIPEEDLYKAEADNGRELEPHVTVLFGTHTNSVKKIEDAIKGTGAVTLTLGKTSVFRQPDYDVLKVDVKSEALHALHKKIAANVPHTDTQPKYQPHLTIAYLKPGKGAKYEGDKTFDGKVIKTAKAHFSNKDHKKKSILLKGLDAVLGLFRKDQLSLFANKEERAPIQSRSKVKGTTLFGRKADEIQPKIGDVKTENGVRYTFLETTPGKPRWHAPNELPSQKAKVKPEMMTRSEFDAQRAAEGRELIDKWNKAGSKGFPPTNKPAITDIVKRAETVGLLPQFKASLEGGKEFPYHKLIVAEALKEGRPVNPENLKTYPDLAKPSQPEVKSKDELTDAVNKRVAKEQQESEPPKAQEPEADVPTTDDEEAKAEEKSRREYVDVGEKIGGARKDVWAEKLALGEVLSGSDVDLDELEKDPTVAYKVVTKENFMGKASTLIADFQRKGYTANATFLLGRLFQYITPVPEDNPLTRKQYVMAADLLQRTVLKATTVEEVINNVNELNERHGGYFIPTEDAEKLSALETERKQLYEDYHAKDEASTTLFSLQNSKGYEITKLKGKKKAVPQELIDEAERLNKEWQEGLPAWRAAEEKYRAKLREASTIREKWDKAADADPFSERNVINSLGERFINALHYKWGKSAFLDSINEAKKMKPDDWSWATGKEKVTQRVKSVDKMPKWKRDVPEKVERVAPTPARETFKPQDLIDVYGIRGVEYGNWMDEESSKFHTQLAGLALNDLAGVLGIENSTISYGGRLALAFGARGMGAAGWKDSAPAAHYEAQKTVINLTKFAGGGSLAHEWGHFLDNVVARVSNGDKSGRQVYLSSNDGGSEMPVEVSEAFKKLTEAMFDGTRPAGILIRPDKKQEKYSWRGVDEKIGTKPAQELYDEIAIKYDRDEEQRLKMAENYTDPKKVEKEKAKITRKANMDRKAAAEYIATKTNTNIRMVKSGERKTISEYLAVARVMGEYELDPKELFARAFESYIQDKLTEQEMKNSYLVYGTHDRPDEKLYWMNPQENPQYPYILETTKKGEDSLPYFPYPRGEERKKINEAMESFIAALRGTEMLKKALEIMAVAS